MNLQRDMIMAGIVFSHLNITYSGGAQNRPERRCMFPISTLQLFAAKFINVDLWSHNLKLCEHIFVLAAR